MENSKNLRQYGLEFIEEMARDRERSLSEVGVVISSAKTSFFSGRHQPTFNDAEEFVKYCRKEVSKIVDGELSKITIKSLGRIRKVITGQDKFSVDDSEHSKVVSKIKDLETQLDDLKSQIKTKNTEIRELEINRDELQKEITDQKDHLDQATLEVKKGQSQIESLKAQHETTMKSLEKAKTDLQTQTNLIDELKKADEDKSKDIESAMATMVQTYQSQEDYTNKLVEETVQHRLEEANREFALEQEDLSNRLQQELNKSKESADQYEKTIKRLEESITMAEGEQQALKDRIDQITQEKTEGGMLLDYTQRLLSSHPLYGSVLILMNLGGTMDLATLAKSVGAHPVRLLQMMEELSQKGLISISMDDPPIISIAYEG